MVFETETKFTKYSSEPFVIYRTSQIWILNNCILSNLTKYKQIFSKGLKLKTKLFIIYRNLANQPYWDYELNIIPLCYYGITKRLRLLISRTRFVNCWVCLFHRYISLWRERLSTVDLLIEIACFVKKYIIKSSRSKPISTRRSIVLIPPFQ